MTTEVKICGIRSEEALDAAIDAGADYIGLVLYPKSPRNVDLATAARLAERAHRSFKTRPVALLVDPDDELVRAVDHEVQPFALQLHGHESLERVRRIAAMTETMLWKAVSIATEADVDAARAYINTGRVARLLYDAKPPSDATALPGGNGLTFDWRILAREPYVGALAGGLTPDNVAEAIRLVNPQLVDVSSGVETSPGQKSPELIRRFIQAAKGAKGR